MKVVPIATKSATSASWSSEQCVVAFLDDIRAGKIDPQKIFILWFSQEADKSLRPHRWFANMTSAEEIALLELAQHIAIEQWKGDH